MGNDVQNDGYVGQANETTPADEFNAMTFLINQVMSGKWTISICQVKAVNGGGLTAAPATVNVQPMVNQVDGQGNATAHGVINNIPVFRMQGGTSAVVIEPVEGDIGLIACASRDISTVVKNQAVSNPGSARTFSPSDGLYIGGFLNKAPQQFCQISSDGITFGFAGSPVALKLTTAGIQLVGTNNNIGFSMTSTGISMTSGSASLVIANNGQVTINGMAWDIHTHAILGGVGSQTGTPVN